MSLVRFTAIHKEPFFARRHRFLRSACVPYSVANIIGTWRKANCTTGKAESEDIVQYQVRVCCAEDGP